MKDQPLLDLNYVEDVAASVDMNLVMNSAGEFIELQGSGEEATFTELQLANLLALGKAGISRLLIEQEKETNSHLKFIQMPTATSHCCLLLVRHAEVEVRYHKIFRRND